MVLPRPEESIESASSPEHPPSTAETEKPTPEPTAVDTDEGPSPATLSGTSERSDKQSSREDSLLSPQALAVDIDCNFEGSEISRVRSRGYPRQQSRKTRLFVWGYVMSSVLSRCAGTNSFVDVPPESFREKENGRLGLSNFPRTTLSDVSFPVELHIPGVQLVRLAASGR